MMKWHDYFDIVVDYTFDDGARVNGYKHFVRIKSSKKRVGPLFVGANSAERAVDFAVQQLSEIEKEIDETILGHNN